MKSPAASALELSRTVVRARLLPVVQVPSPTSHSVPPTIAYRVVSLFARTAENAWNPDTAPARERVPVPVVLVVSWTRSARMCANCYAPSRS